MSMKERFCNKLYEELQSFQNELLGKSKEDILNASYKREVFVNLYHILLEVADELSEALLLNLVSQSVNILESLYSDFISDSSEDSLYEDLRHHVQKEFDENSEEGCCWWDSPTYEEGA